QRVERMAELALRRLALEKLQVVDDEDVDAAQRLLEGERRLRLQCRYEAVHEFFGGEIEHLALADGISGPGDRLQQVGLAEAHAGMDVERVEHDRIAAPGGRDLLRRRVCQRVGTANRKAVDGEARVERRAAE